MTEIAMLGVGEKVDVIRESLKAVSEATNDEGGTANEPCEDAQ